MSIAADVEWVNAISNRTMERFPTLKGRSFCTVLIVSSDGERDGMQLQALPFKLKRRQFLVRLAFAMINTNYRRRSCSVWD